RRLHQTANRRRSRPALRLGRTTAGRRPAPRENRAFPAPAIQNGGLTLERGEFLVGSTRGQPPGKVISSPLIWTKPIRPGANQTGEVGNRGARVRRGILVPNDWFLAVRFLALVPGCLS